MESGKTNIKTNLSGSAKLTQKNVNKTTKLISGSHTESKASSHDFAKNGVKLREDINKSKNTMNNLINDYKNLEN